MEYNVLLYERELIMGGQLEETINNTAGFHVVRRFQTATDAIGQGGMFQPNLILFDTTGKNAITLLEKFHEAFPRLPILCTGDQWRADTASRFLQAGGSGYIVKPFTTEELKEAVENFAKNGSGRDSSVYTFFSPKGKSGKTTLIANLALALARRTREQVGIIDADLQFGDMAVFFNLQPATTIVEAVRDSEFLQPVAPSSYFMPVTENVRVLCGTRTPNLIDRVAIDGFERILAMSRELFRYVLIDVPQAFNPTSIAAAEASDATFLCAMKNDGYEVYHMMRALEIFKDWPDYQERVKPIFTRVTPCNAASREKLSDDLGFPVAAVIPNAYDIVSTAADNGRMAVDIEPSSALTQAVNKLADQLTRGSHVAMEARA